MKALVVYLLALMALPLALLASLAVILGDAVASLAGHLRPRSHDAPATARDHKHVTIIILNWNGRELLAQGLPAVLAAVQQAGGEHDVMVVDNGSTDGSADYVRSAFPGVTVLALEHNLGFGPGNNAGVKVAKSDIVVLLNNDMVVDPGFLQPLLAPFADARVFAVSSQIFMGDSSVQRVETGLTRGEMRSGLFFPRHESVAGDAVSWQPCLWAGGGSAAFDRRRFLELGGFDSLYAPFYVEDVDVSYRAWKRGWTVLFEPASIVFHRHRASTGRLGADAVDRAFAKNARLFVWRNITDLAWTLASILRVPGDMAAAITSQSKNESAALGWALRQFPAAMRRRWAAVAAADRTTGSSDRDVFSAACSRYGYRERYEPAPALPEDGRKRILVVCPYLPVPPAHGGAVRMLNLIKQLARRNDVDVLSFMDSEDERVFAPQLAPYCRRLRLLARRPPVGVYHPLSDRSWHIEEFAMPEMRQTLQEMMSEEDYHVVQIEYTQMAQYHPGTRRSLTALDEIDVAFRALHRRSLAGRGMPGRQDVVDYLKVKRFELESCRRFDHVLAMSTTDAAYLASFLPERAETITDIANGVDTSYYTPAPVWPGGQDILFVGSYRHTPNQDGMRFFMSQVFPQVRQAVPGVHLYVVGDGAWAGMDEIAGQEAVTATGFVEDTRPWLARCALTVAPILSGSGTRIKILDALAAGIPIVSTTIGAEGIAARPNEDILIADDAQAFAAAIVRLLGDPLLAEKLRRNGRRLAEEKYDWQAIVAKLDGMYNDSLRQRSVADA